MRMRRWRWIDVNIVIDEELLQHLTRSNEEVAITALASELE